MPQTSTRSSGAHTSLQGATQEALAEPARSEVPPACPAPPARPKHQDPSMPTQRSPPGHPMRGDGCQLPPAHHTAHPSRQDTAVHHRRARERGCSRHRRRPGVRLRTWSRRVLRERGSPARGQPGWPRRAPTGTHPMQLATWGSQHSPTERGTGHSQGHPRTSCGAGGRTAASRFPPGKAGTPQAP